MLKYILTLAIAGNMQAQNIHATGGFVHGPVEVEHVYAAPAMSIASGPHVLINSHSGQSLAVQTLRGRLLAAQSDVPVAWEFVSTDGGYLISTAQGSLTEVEGRDGVRIGKGTTWTVHPAGEGAIIIRSQASGRLLEIANWSILPGSWAALNIEIGGSNQEWIIGDKDSRVRSASHVATMRTLAGETTSNTAARASKANAPKTAWHAVDGGFVYDIHISDPSLQRLILENAYDIYDAVPVKTPEGWMHCITNWFPVPPDTVGASGTFSIKSSWAPGPAMLRVVAEGGSLPVLFSGYERARQRQSIATAGLAQGHHYRVIGPAIPPNVDEATLRKLIDSWVMGDGIAFLDPMLDESKPLKSSILDLQPRDHFERQVTDLLRATVENLR